MKKMKICIKKQIKKIKKYKHIQNNTKNIIETLKNHQGSLKNLKRTAKNKFSDVKRSSDKIFKCPSIKRLTIKFPRLNASAEV